MKGFLYDIYHIKDKAILWVKVNDKKVKRLEYSWSPFIYVVSDKKFELTLLLNNDKIMSFIKEYEFVNKFDFAINEAFQHKRDQEITADR